MLLHSAVLAHFLLREKLRKLGIYGCVLCIVGSTLIVLHAPSEHSLSSVEEIWELATQPGIDELGIFLFILFLFLFIYLFSLMILFDLIVPAFLLYTASAIAVVLVLVLYCEPRYGQTNIMVYIGICSIIGSLTVSFFFFPFLHFLYLHYKIKSSTRDISIMNFPRLMM